MKKIFLILVVFLISINSSVVRAEIFSEEQQRVFQSGVRYFNTEPDDNPACGTGANGGDLDRFLQVLSFQESGGNPLAQSSSADSAASGKYQYIKSTWHSSSKQYYQPGDAYNRAKDAPEAVQDAVAYLEYTVKFKDLGGDMFKMAVSHYVPAALTNPSLLDKVPPGGNTLTPRQYGDKLVDNINKGVGSDIPMKYKEAPDFQTWLDKIGGATSTGSTTPSLDSSCSGGSGIVIGNYSFPVAPQKKSENGGVPGMSALPCNQASCHHDGTPAFDISRKPGGDAIVGTPVYAITSGTIKSIDNSYMGHAGCQSLQLEGQDTYWYWYGHIQSISVQENQTVKAGQQVAVIGERRCTDNGSDSHLHIDRGCVQNNVPQPGGSVSCRDPGMIEIINGLFNALPE